MTEFSLNPLVTILSGAMPRWIATRRGLLRAERAVEIDGEELMVYRSPRGYFVFTVAHGGGGHLEEVTGERRDRALAEIGASAAI